MLAETRKEVKENTKLREKVLTSGAKSEERKKRPVVAPYIRGFPKELERIFGNPSLNRDGRRYNLLMVWDNIKEGLTDIGAGTENGGGPGLRNSVSVPVSLQRHLEITSC